VATACSPQVKVPDPQPPVPETVGAETTLPPQQVDESRPSVPPPPSPTPMAKPLGQGFGFAAGGAFLARAPFNTEAYDRTTDNGWKLVGQEPLSTFSADVDTAAYSNLRRFLNTGQRVPKDAVRVEELINYFDYEYPDPTGPHPFSVTTEVGACPWAPDHRLLMVGLQAKRLDTSQLPPRNLVFLIDVSGSMGQSNKLPLVKAALSMLVGHLGARDRVAIVVYAGATGVVLPSTPATDRSAILSAISDLTPGGGTNGAAGIELAYQLARDNFTREGVNRVVLATDGDFNLGITDRGSLLRLIEERRKQGVALTVLGFGMGNLKDATLEQLADTGNGNYAYIDTLSEAQKVLVTEAGGTLVTVAKDVKLQLEFNPRHVAAFRLIGYENRISRTRTSTTTRRMPEKWAPGTR
jgi:Ca-activated chloride channel family protein